MIPLVLKFKHQFKNSGLLRNFGYTMDAGLLVGISNTNKYSGRAKFNYEAIYNYDGDESKAVYDDGEIDDDSQIVTEDYWTQNPTAGETLETYFTRKKNEGLNVALNQNIKGNGQTNYSKKVSLGFLLQPSINTKHL